MNQWNKYPVNQWNKYPSNVFHKEKFAASSPRTNAEVSCIECVPSICYLRSGNNTIYLKIHKENYTGLKTNENFQHVKEKKR